MNFLKGIIGDPCYQSQDKIILISSDDEDEDEDAGHVILISSDEEEDVHETKFSIKTHQSIKVEPKIEGQLSPSLSSDEGFCKSSDSDSQDLPDIPNLSCISRVLISDSKGDLIDDPEEQQVTTEFISPSKRAVSGLKEEISPVFSPCKRLKVQEVLSITLLSKLKQKIINSLMTGDLKRVRSVCSYDIDSCFNTHRKEGSITSTTIQSKYLWEVMFDNKKLQHFALRAMCQAVNKKQFLHHAVCNMLIEHIHGSEEKMEMPDLQHVYLGISILRKQLALHPTCRREMRQYYLKMCSTWWPCLMRSAANLVMNRSSMQTKELQRTKEVFLPASFELKEALRDFSDIMQKEELETHVLFKNISKAEKFHRISMLMKYFTLVMSSNVLVWLIKFRHNDKTLAFRKDISPIVAEITWSNDIVNFGAVNQCVKELFRLYSKSSMEQNLHSVLSVMINMKAVVIHRREKSSYPEMGQLTRSFAYELFSVIQASSNVEDNVCAIRPHWLRFLVGSYLLGVEEPANFYKAKERIHQLLNAKDKGQNDKCFDVETLCFFMLESMTQMMGFSSVPTESFVSIKKLREDNEDLWFKQMLSDDFLKKNIMTLSDAISHPSVQCKNRKGYFFDYVEGDIQDNFEG